MNLPVGAVKEKGIALPSFRVKEKFIALMNESFTGYAVLTLEGFQGIEEGVTFFKKGSLVAVIYEYAKQDAVFYGDLAIAQLWNGYGAQYGIIDIYTLTAQQFDLVSAFNEKILLSTPLNNDELNKLDIAPYNQDVGEKALEGFGNKEESQYDVLKKFGLEKVV
jgi:hypothetical protein